MPWRGRDAELAETGFPFPSLGFEAADWIEAHCVIPDGDRMGQPYILTDEMLVFLIHFYRVDPDSINQKTGGQRFHYERGGQFVRPQKHGKGPFSSAVICNEVEGPALPDGWKANGEPVGRPWPTPLVQVTAVSEDQTANVFRALVPMIQLGPLSALIPDTGLTRINLRGGGRIEPVTASARSRLGQRLTFAVQDETHSWEERNQGIRLADNQRRNLSGMGGRFMETTNAWDPAVPNVAQMTNENPVGVYVDYPPPISGSVRNKRERRKVMRRAYGDSCRDGPDGRWKAWVDLDRIDAEVEALLAHDPAQAERFFLNRANAGESVAFEANDWAQCAKPELVIPHGSLVAIGVDGARFDDALAIVATDITTFHQWPLAILERPANAGPDYEHDLALADGAMVEAFERYEVWRAYCDPQYIEGLVEGWQGRWGDDVVVNWFTNRPRQVAWACRKFRTAMAAGDMTHDGDSVMARHVLNARREPLNVRDEDGRPMWRIRKDRPHSPNKIDGAMAGVISAECRSDAVAAGVLNQPTKPRWFMGV